MIHSKLENPKELELCVPYKFNEPQSNNYYAIIVCTEAVTHIFCSFDQKWAIKVHCTDLEPTVDH